MSNESMNAPPASKNAIDSGSSVFVMWNFVACGFGYRNAIAVSRPEVGDEHQPAPALLGRIGQPQAQVADRSVRLGDPGGHELETGREHGVRIGRGRRAGRRASRRAGRGFRGIGVRRRRDRRRGRIGRRRGERWLVGAGAGAQHQQRDQQPTHRPQARRRRRAHASRPRRRAATASSPISCTPSCCRS